MKWSLSNEMSSEKNPTNDRTNPQSKQAQGYAIKSSYKKEAPGSHPLTQTPKFCDIWKRNITHEAKTEEINT